MRELNELKQVVEQLRAENGCPWDRAQTHESLKAPLIEEAAEVLCGINVLGSTGSPANLREELGDLLLQIVFHAVIAEENGEFTLTDVIRDITEKMRRRHPHVFGRAQLETDEEIRAAWEAAKKAEKEARAAQGPDAGAWLPAAFEESRELIARAEKRKGIR